MPAIQAGQARGLDSVETFDTVSSMQHSGIFVGLGGWVYILIGPAEALQGSRRGKARLRLQPKQGPASTA